ncbi:hypothetical protein KSP39_PZI010570 [Platanthera zijinensis]|uniref:Uncharacterized protein n=1 Tax=Platanthera zijinensis TaxID=2320716 RepID=A0AAP0BJB7_9ASPA
MSTKNPSWPQTPIAFACFRSATCISGRCKRRPKHPFGRWRRSIPRSSSLEPNPHLRRTPLRDPRPRLLRRLRRHRAREPR